MGKTIKYLLSGIIIVSSLVAGVVVVRHSRATAAIMRIENLKIKGPKDAPVHLVVYSDFQCPACKNSGPVVEEILNEFPGQILFEFRHYPLERPHKWALLAAMFAQCAAQQDKFWPFHDRLYADQDVWSKSADALPLFVNYSKEMNMDLPKLETCLQNAETTNLIRFEAESGSKKGVQSTPTFYLNDQPLVGSIQLKEKARPLILQKLNKVPINN